MEFFDLKKFKKVGENFKFAELVKVRNPEYVSIGDNVFFNYGVYLEAGEGMEIEIGSNTHFAPYGVIYGPLKVGSNCAFAAHVVLASVGQGYSKVDIPMVKQPTQKKEIIIEDDVWIGANAVVIGGVRIGTGSIVGAGSVVTKNVEPFSVVGGVPARLIRKRK